MDDHLGWLEFSIEKLEIYNSILKFDLPPLTDLQDSCIDFLFQNERVRSEFYFAFFNTTREGQVNTNFHPLYLEANLQVLPSVKSAFFVEHLFFEVFGEDEAG